MCGICGSIGPLEPAARSSMLRALAHRGPDDRGSLELPATRFGPVWLGHQRLAILDLSPNAHQPMSTTNGRFTLVFNGEIYNFAEIRSLLSTLGHRFRGSGDTEVLLAAWERWGETCVERLRGMFAFAIWDANEAVLWLVRDRMGEKPLYFATHAKGLVFASEVRSLLESGLVDRVLDPEGLESYLAFGSVTQPLTLVRNVRAVEPGQIVEYRNGTVTKRYYWQLSDIEAVPGTNLGRIVEEVRAVLDASVGRCLVSDVPIGLLLSGGVDSTAILARMSRRGDALPATFSVGFGGQAQHLSEFEWSDRVAKAFGTDHHRIEVAPQEIRPLIHDALAAMDLPSKDGFNHFIVLQAVARAGYKVAITGQGADELFFGYGHHRTYRLSRLLARLKLPRPVALLIEQSIRRVVPHQERISKLAMLLGPGLPEELAYLARHMVFTHLEIEALLGRRCAPSSRWVGSAGGRTVLDRLYRLETTRLLRNQLLRDGDQMSMAVSLELRAPFVDHALVELAFRLPEAAKVSAVQVKPVLVAAADDPLVTAVSQRPKENFRIPLKHWVGAGVENHQIDAALLGLQPEVVQSHVLRARAGARFERYWTLFVLHEWMVANGVRAA